jgi:hypothetical protein
MVVPGHSVKHFALRHDLDVAVHERGVARPIVVVVDYQLKFVDCGLGRCIEAPIIVQANGLYEV